MRKALAICAALLAVPAVAQQEEPGLFDRIFGSSDETEDQGSFLERLIEDNLSGDDRDVSITGFDGALSGRATIESLTISDPDGTWFTLSDAVLDWNRAALLSGRLEVEELSAAMISLPRLPTPAEAEEPTPEASGFSLPDLPVSIEIGEIAAERVELGQPIIGAEVQVSISGSFSLVDGAGSANLAIQKLDTIGGLTLNASYSNTTQELALILDVDEGPDGIIANLADLPGRPAVAFSVQGDAPLSEFVADISLATDGQQRLSGTVATNQTDDGTFRTLADISGDLAPIFAPDYQPFFGPEVALRASISARPDGTTALDDLTLTAAALTLEGSAVLAQGLPQVINVTGRIADPSGAAVLLPLAGTQTRVDAIDLTIGFDAAQSEDWQGAFSIEGLTRDGFSAKRLELAGAGQIAPGDISATFDFEANALDLGDPDAEEALGETVTGGAEVQWSTDAPITINTLTIIGESYGFEGQADIALRDDGPEIKGSADLRAGRLSVFSGLAQRQLGGRAALQTQFLASPLAGTFEISAEGQTTDLRVDQTEADAILAGQAQLSVSAARDENGLRATLTTLETPNANLSGSVLLKSGGSNVSVSGTLANAALLLPQVSGPVDLKANALEDANRIWAWDADVTMERTRLSASGNARDVFTLPIIAANGRLEADRLSDFADLAKRPVGGAMTADFAGEVVADLSRAGLTLTGLATNVTTGIAQADALLEGRVSFDIKGAVAGDALVLQDSTIDGPQILLQANAALLSEGSRFDVSGRIADAARLLEGAPSGPLAFASDGLQDGRDWRVVAKVDGPGLVVNIDGLALDPYGTPGFDGAFQASVGDLAVFSALAGRPLDGEATVSATGDILADLSSFDLKATATGQNISIGVAAADKLLAGALNADIEASRAGDDITIRRADVSTNLITASASGALGQNASAIELTARLADIATFVDGIAGPLSVAGTVGQTAADYTLDINATGPGGAQARTAGTIAPDFTRVDLSLDGTAPLGLANRFIKPNALSGQARFDLAVNGAPALESVSGQIISEGARFSATGANITLLNIATTTSLSGGRAQIALTGDVEGGGRIAIDGPLILSAPFPADLVIALSEVRLSDPKLFETDVSGRVSVSGPLSGGARISGTLGLGETNVQIPSSSIGGTGEIPEIVHLNEPPPVRGTRRRAGLLEQASNGSASGPIYPLDITINAPNRIFVRGRGLDSEFGGALRVTGTTRDVVPIGAFNLVRGRLDILGQRLALNEATVTMQGSFVPILRILATTQSDEYTINVLVSGPASNPDILFTSQPELPQEEVLARLIFGRGLETLSPIQAARLALAVRTLAGQGGEGVVGNIRNSTGLADLDITTDEEGNAAVRAGAYLGENIYTDVEVGSGGNTSVNLNLDVSPSVTVKGSVSTDGDTSVGVFFERDY